MSIDFKQLNAQLLQIGHAVCVDMLPGGKRVGNEYVCSNLGGGNGRSFSVNLSTGVWADFSNDACKGGDLISLHAAQHNLTQILSARSLAETYRIKINDDKQKEKQSEPTCIVPTAGTPAPSMKHRMHGEPSGSWCYRDANGSPMFYVARYDTPDGKQFCPFSWDGERWRQKSWSKPRPMYNLHLLASRPDDHVLIVEGEKTCDAAHALVGDVYICMTWANGSKSVGSTTFHPLRDRDVVLWADADEPGVRAMDDIATEISGYARSVKIIDVTGMPDRWDCADFTGDYDEWLEWARPRLRGVSTPDVVSGETIPTKQPEQSTAMSIDPQELNVSSVVAWSKLGIVCAGNGQPICNADNVSRVLDTLEKYRGHVWADEFYGQIYTDIDGQQRQWTDNDNLKLLRIVQRNLHLSKLSSSICHEGVATVAAHDVRHAPQDWINSLPAWDGVERLPIFLRDYFGADDTEYNASAGSNWLISIAARILSPGCEAHHALVLKSAQGAGKSTAMRALIGNWYVSATRSVTSDKFFEILNGKIIVEIAEMTAFTRADIETVKAVITTPSDFYRVPYERIARDHPRSCVFAVTTNSETPLTDPTGARRFWCVDIGKIDVEKIKSDRNQIFSEAREKYLRGDTWWLMPAEETAEIEEKNREQDPWEDIIDSWLIGRSEVSTTMVAEQCLDIPAERITKSIQVRISHALKSCGWTKTTSRRGSKVRKIWVREMYPTVTNVTTCDIWD